MKIARVMTETGDVHTVSLDPQGRALIIDGDLFGSFSVSDREVSFASFLAPIEPRQIFGIGLNYAKHADESGMGRPERPIVFFKGLGSVVGADADIVLPANARSEKVDYECELAVVIGRDCRNVSREDALGVVLGYTAANDISARDWQLEWGGVSGDTGSRSTPFAPWAPC
jgi:2-keto-4-pentenoate hydratase/2-oxohepta-3-ene-1,7-dioic acid hydratase in catechol pathway